MSPARELELWRELTGRWFPARVDVGCTAIVGNMRLEMHGDRLPTGYLAAIKGKVPKRRAPKYPLGMALGNVGRFEDRQRAAYDLAMATGRWAPER